MKPHARQFLSALCGVVTITSTALATEYCYHLETSGPGCSFSSFELTPTQCVYSVETEITVKDAVNSEDKPGKKNSSSTFTLVCSRTIGTLDSNGECSIDSGSQTDAVYTLHSSISGDPCNAVPGGGGGPA